MTRARGGSSADSERLVRSLRRVVGRRYVLTAPGATRHYSIGYREGGGAVLAVVRPGSLREQWETFRLIIAAGQAVIVQAANTGLTGGSTPSGVYRNGIVIINTLRVTGLYLLRGGRQVLCLSGTTLHQLERRLRPLGREPHSVIGSSCIGASVIGGICNNSGGALVRRGPAYTEYALYARVDEKGEVELCNRLGIALGGDPETILRRLDGGTIEDADIEDDARSASAADYEHVVRAVDAPTPARYNADPSRLFEASGSAGKVMVMAVRLDTFRREEGSVTFYVGTNDENDLSRLRRHILEEGSVPISAEYLHRDAFAMAERYGKDSYLALRWLGTERMPALASLKFRLDRIASGLKIVPLQLPDRLLQALSRLVPYHLPRRLRAFGKTFEHQLILKVDAGSAEGIEALMEETLRESGGASFRCSAQEAEAAFLHRFAVAGAAIRYRAVHKREVQDLIALDVALRRNDPEWFERLPEDIAQQIVASIQYGHFFCHVFHRDYLVRKGADASDLERRMLTLLDARGAEYPAEHNVGHHYRAKPALADHYRRLDPANRLNPGIGGTSREVGWRAR